MENDYCSPCRLQSVLWWRSSNKSCLPYGTWPTSKLRGGTRTRNCWVFTRQRRLWGVNLTPLHLKSTQQSAAVWLLLAQFFLIPPVVSTHFKPDSINLILGTEQGQLKPLGSTSLLRGTKAFCLAHVLYLTVIPAVNPINQCF